MTENSHHAIIKSRLRAGLWYAFKFIIAVIVGTILVYITWKTLDSYFNPPQYEDDTEIERKV